MLKMDSFCHNTELLITMSLCFQGVTKTSEVFPKIFVLVHLELVTLKNPYNENCSLCLRVTCMHTSLAVVVPLGIEAVLPATRTLGTV